LEQEDLNNLGIGIRDMEEETNFQYIMGMVSAIILAWPLWLILLGSLFIGGFGLFLVVLLISVFAIF
jgi:uncharacterized membrane protein